MREDLPVVDFLAVFRQNGREVILVRSKAFMARKPDIQSDDPAVRLSIQNLYFFAFDPDGERMEKERG